MLAVAVDEDEDDGDTATGGGELPSSPPLAVDRAEDEQDEDGVVIITMDSPTCVIGC